MLSTNLEYGALDLAWEHVCGDFGARYVRTPVRLPVESAEEIVETIWSGVGPRTKVLYLSHYTSSTALTLPVAELCRRAREHGIRSIVDGAHVPGHLPLDLRAIDADFYAGNCHKWLCAPKGAGFLYVRRELQREVHPLMVSWGYADDDPGFVDRHEKQGTRDPSAYLTVPAAIAWQRDHDWDAQRERCHGLARRARNELGLEPLTPDSAEFFRQMITLRLPAGTPPDLKERLYDEYRIEVPVFELDGETYIRSVVPGLQRRGRPRAAAGGSRGAALGGCRVRERVLEHVERLLGRRGKLEAEPRAAVLDRHRECVRVAAPEKRYLDAVRRAVVELCDRRIGHGPTVAAAVTA